MFSTNTKLKPFNSDPIKVERQAICAVTFGSNSVPVKWQIIAAECEPILVGNSATALGILEFNRKQGIIAPINMIHTDPKGEIQSCLAGLNFPFRISVNHINRCYYTLFTTEFKNSYSHNFRGIGKLKNHQIKLHVNTEVKPVATAPALFHTTSKNKYLNLYKK